MNWTALKHRIAASAAADELERAIRANDRDTVVKILRANPEMLHLPVWSGNWGPPMSHAANLGRLEIIKAVAQLGARDFQHAFDRAAIDFAEREIFGWLLAHGADVNARAIIDTDGFGGHTPLFHAVVCGPRRDTAVIEALLARGASKDVRASLRKFLDWCENPRWHEARDVTAAEWGDGFPEGNWVNIESLRLLDEE